MSRDQNAKKNHNVKNDNKSFETVEQFKCLGTNLTDQNSLQEEIKSRSKSGNARYHSVQNLLSSRLLSKNVKLCRNIMFVVFMGAKLGRSHSGRNVG
jgi:hypothetical protein